MDKQVVISTKSIILLLCLLLGGYIAYRLGAIIGIFLLATIIVFAIEPLVKKIMRITFMNKLISRNAAVAIAYIILVCTVALFVTLWLPPFISESQRLIRNFPKIVTTIQVNDKLNINLADLFPQASKISGDLFGAVLSVFSNLATLISVLVISLYLSTDWPNIKRRFAALFPGSAEDTVNDTLNEIENSLGNWVKGELILMLTVGLASFLGLIALGISYPLALGLISGFFEVIPMIGPILSAAVAALIALAISPVKALGVVALYLVIQQLENSFLVPKVMQKVSGFSPLIVLLSLLIGGTMFGLMGAMLAIPMAMVIGILIRRFFMYVR